MSKKIVCVDYKNDKYEVNERQVSFRPSVYGVLIEDGKVLMSKQWDGYDFPGGGVDIGETVHEAVIREFFEETGLTVEVIDVIHCETSFFHPSRSEKHKNEYWNCPLIYFTVKKISGDLSVENFDEEEKNYADMPEWIEIEKMGDIKFFNSVDSVQVVKKGIERG